MIEQMARGASNAAYSATFPTRAQELLRKAPALWTGAAMLATAAFAPPLATPAAAATDGGQQVAQVAGEWTRCVAWLGSTTYNIVNGSGSQDRCFALARRCINNDPAGRMTYYTPAVIVNAPYVRCTAQ